MVHGVLLYLYIVVFWQVLVFSDKWLISYYLLSTEIPGCVITYCSFPPASGYFRCLMNGAAHQDEADGRPSGHWGHQDGCEKVWLKLELGIAIKTISHIGSFFAKMLWNSQLMKYHRMHSIIWWCFILAQRLCPTVHVVQWHFAKIVRYSVRTCVCAVRMISSPV